MTQAQLLRIALARLLLGLCLLSGINCAASKMGKSLDITVTACGVADIITTQQGLNAGAVEMNPLAQDARVRIGLKAAGVATVLGVAKVTEDRGHPTRAQVMRIVAASTWCGAALWNSQQR